MFDNIFKFWRNKQRKIDLDILWPTCKELAPNIDIAEACFAYHAFNDTAYTKDYNEKEIIEYINKLS